MTITDIVRRAHIGYLNIRSKRMATITPVGRVLVVAPHPDDEVIGCGGLIVRLVDEGNPPHIIVMTGGEGSHSYGCCHTASEQIIKARRGLTRRAMDILGVPVSNIHEFNFADGGICAENYEQTRALEQLIIELNPDTILVPHWGEGWNDHVMTARIVKEIASQKVPHALKWEYCVWMWYYNVWRGLDWRNAAVLRMTPHEHNLKLMAMDAYIKPLAPCGRPWSGVLPTVFIKANQDWHELYFKVK